MCCLNEECTFDNVSANNVLETGGPLFPALLGLLMLSRAAIKYLPHSKQKPGFSSLTKTVLF